MKEQLPPLVLLRRGQTRCVLLRRSHERHRRVASAVRVAVCLIFCGHGGELGGEAPVVGSVVVLSIAYVC